METGDCGNGKVGQTDRQTDSQTERGGGLRKGE